MICETVICDGCALRTITRRRSVIRSRRRNTVDNKIYCSRRCARQNSQAVRTIKKERQKVRLEISDIAKQKRLKNYPDTDLPFNEYLRRTIYRTTTKKYENDLSVAFLKCLWKNQNGLCAITSIPLVHPLLATNINHKASLDRINSSKGYIQGNVQFVSCAINYAKNNNSDQMIHDFIRLLIEHYPGCQAIRN